MQQLAIQITRHIIMTVMLLISVQSYGQIVIGGDTSSYSGVSNGGGSNNSYSGYSGGNNNSNYPNKNNNSDSIDVSKLTGLPSTSWSGTSFNFNNGVAGYVANNPSSLPTPNWSGTASNYNLSGYNGNNNDKSGDSIDVSQLRGLPTNGYDNTPFNAAYALATYAAMNPNGLPRDCTGCWQGVAAVNPNYGFYSGTAFVGPTMDSDIYTSQQQLEARLAGDKIRAILGRDNTLTNEQQYQAEKGLKIANFVAGISNALPNGVIYSEPSNVAFLDTFWDAGNVIYDAGKYVAGKLTGNQQLVDEAKTDIVWDTAAAAIPFVPAGTTKVLRAADAATNLNKLPDSTVVCRGGACTADRFVNGSGVSVDVKGNLQNVSVNSAPGASLSTLSQGVPNAQIGVSTVGAVRGAGGDVISSPNVNNMNHATMFGITPQQAESLFTPTVKNPNK